MRLRGTTGAVIAVAGAIGGGAALPAGASAACTKATNIEAIIDDSGSMAVTDPNRLRVQAMDLLINALSSGTFLGAVEFGGSFDGSTPSADTVFKPEAVGSNAAAMKSAMDTLIMADNGLTDYNAAFAQSDADNPNAQARIFLTDGAHNAGDYTNGHLNHKVPTYVIGFSPGFSTDDAARLQSIASDTGGSYHPLPDSSALQSVMNSIEAALTCQTPPQSFTDQLAQGKAKTHSVSIGANTKSLQVALTWPSPLDAFSISGLKLVNHGRTIAVGARRKLKVKRTTNATFVLLKISGLQRGRLKFKVKATKVGSGQPRATLTTQVSHSRK
jgi:hypothetical protein